MLPYSQRSSQPGIYPHQTPPSRYPSQSTRHSLVPTAFRCPRLNPATIFLIFLPPEINTFEPLPPVPRARSSNSNRAIQKSRHAPDSQENPSCFGKNYARRESRRQRRNRTRPQNGRAYLCARARCGLPQPMRLRLIAGVRLNAVIEVSCQHLARTHSRAASVGGRLYRQQLSSLAYQLEPATELAANQCS